jgi:CDP-paratose 2-epimerase
VAHHVLVTGGAGFVGASLCIGLAQRRPDWRVTALDNLKRRGSELNLPRLRAHGVAFVHGDVRVKDDLLALGKVDAIVECSAEPSALAGVGEPPDYLVQSNLTGAYHCLELARRDDAQLVFISTSRVYPYRTLDALAHTETATRFELDDEQAVPGASARGVSEAFPLEGPRTLYGATKLAAELLVTEYAAIAGLPLTVNRCGVLAGPWQMGKVDQGVFTWWVLAHHLGRPLSYIGYGGQGKQVRDLLHVEDLVELIDRQLGAPDDWRDVTANVGGGREVSLSLAETTALCAQVTGVSVPVTPAGADRPGDVRVYLGDSTRLYGLTDWRPQRDAETIIADIAAWIRDHEQLVVGALA